MAGTAVSEDLFTERMAAVGPFEAQPFLAVAVSGGADSLALCLLAARWAERRSGRLAALTVDHGLRADSAAEAERVGAWLAARGIEHHVLPWEGAKPKTRVQEAARRVRYDLLTGWCRENGALHLALAHQLEDQAETFLMRLSRNSGEDGLAGISAIVETAGVRLVRPLLGVSREDLRDTLREFGQAWIEDPSNANRKFERVRVRGLLPGLSSKGISPDRIGMEAAGYARRRIEGEAETARLLAATCRVFPAGYARIFTGSWGEVPDPAAMRGLARLTQTIGGGDYAPNREKLGAVLAWMRKDGGPPSATLGGCRFRRRGNEVIVLRESRRLPKPVRVVPHRRLVWDRRFNIVLSESVPDGAVLGPLGRAGWNEAVSLAPELRGSPIPHPARLVLPALFDAAGIRDIPILNFHRPENKSGLSAFRSAFFNPRNSLSGTGFCLADGVSSTISSSVMEAARSAFG